MPTGNVIKRITKYSIPAGPAINVARDLAELGANEDAQNLCLSILDREDLTPKDEVALASVLEDLGLSDYATAVRGKALEATNGGADGSVNWNSGRSVSDGMASYFKLSTEPSIEKDAEDVGEVEDVEDLCYINAIADNSNSVADARTLVEQRRFYDALDVFDRALEASDNDDFRRAVCDDISLCFGELAEMEEREGNQRGVLQYRAQAGQYLLMGLGLKTVLKTTEVKCPLDYDSD